MKKTYIVKKSSFKEVVKGKITINFLLADENGKTSVVSAIAKLGWNNKIKTLHAVYKREQALIKVLSTSSIHDKIHVQYTGFKNTQVESAKNFTLKSYNKSKKIMDHHQAEISASHNSSQKAGWLSTKLFSFSRS